MGERTLWCRRERTRGREGERGGGKRGMEVRSEPSNTSGHQTSIPTLSEEEAHEMGQGRGEGAHVPAHRQGANEAVAVQDRESGGSTVQVRRGTERSASPDVRVRGEEEETMGGDMGRQGLLWGGDEVPERSGERSLGAGGTGGGNGRGGLVEGKGRREGFNGAAVFCN